jgi:fibrillarin-like pre-rRNA processing protein
VRLADRPSLVDRGEHLYRRREGEFHSYWTEALGEPAPVYGERITSLDQLVLRRWDPSRSKLGAALTNGWEGPLPRSGELWLYLGASTGTTASHVADLVGLEGFVFAVEKSLRPFARLLALAQRYPNLGPVLGDARDPLAYLPVVPPVDGVYLDVAQPDQVEIGLANARWFLRPGGALVLALKTASMGRTRSAREHLLDATRQLEVAFEVEETLSLEPYHKRHFLIGGRPTGAVPPTEGRPLTNRPVRLSGRRS